MLVMPFSRYFIFICCFIPSLVQAASVDLNQFKVSDNGDSTRVVMKLSGAVKYSIFTLKKPDRLVVDLKNINKKTHKITSSVKNPFIKFVRSGVRNHHDFRIVFDLKSKVKPKSFVLKPSKKNNMHRLVIDLSSYKSKREIIAKKKIKKQPKLKSLVIAIDAGHGGKDIGAQGYKGTLEKKVVFKIAKKLEALIKKQRGMKAVMIRNGDYFLKLKQRIAKARKYKADLFISIHADAFRNPQAKGASVYVLSRNSASSVAARWLADRENASDLIGGVSLGDKDNVLASVLMDMSQTATIEASLKLGNEVLSGLKNISRIHKRQVQKAGFVVLKSPDIPSILVETAFISNPGEERNLNNGTHQWRLAQAMMKGIARYFNENPIPGTYYAAKQLEIVVSDKLPTIARSLPKNMSFNEELVGN
jgi:N-acetylmuramoyl-L-alanine amidase